MLNMDDRFVKKLLVPSFVILILSAVFFYELKNVIDFLFFKNKNLLIIGILSAPENFEQRISIRETWLQLLPEISARSYFLIGNEICDVHPVDRIDPYSCIEKPYLLPKNSNNETEFTTLRFKSEIEEKTTYSSFIGFGFYVRKGILVKKLGVLKKLLTVFTTEIQVKLISASDNKVLASVTFSSDMIKEYSPQLIAKEIKPVVLIEGQEAYVKLDMKNVKNLFPVCGKTDWENIPNVLNYVYLWSENSVIPQQFNPNSCTFVFMNYTIVDIDNLKHLIKNRSLRQREWCENNVILSGKLKNETKKYNDLMFLDVVDVYRNLTLKMVKFFKHVTETKYFHYILKVDDDSFVDLLRIHNQLKEVNRETDSEISGTMGKHKETGLVAKVRLSRFWCWSYFKELWKVQRSGKWRDDQYSSVSYPAFPCGGGYVLNKGIVDFIATNENSLHHFQGEDVSIGIWISSLSVTKYKTPKINFPNNSFSIQKKIISRFQGKRMWEKHQSDDNKFKVTDLCDWTCTNEKHYHLPFCNKVQLNVKNMYDTWAEYISNGFI